MIAAALSTRNVYDSDSDGAFERYAVGYRGFLDKYYNASSDQPSRRNLQ